MHSGAMLFLHLFDRLHFASQAGDSSEFLLNHLKTLVSLAVGQLSFCSIPAFPPVLLVQLLDLSDLGAKASDLFSKNL